MSLIVERLGHLGNGIAAGPVFAPLCLPGEEIDGVIDQGRIYAPKILTPSPDRVKPVCSHFKTCGGCALQHGSDAFVADFKAQVVRDALAAHGIEAHIRGVKTSPAQSRRRATFSGKRTKKGALVGFHGRASDVLIEIPKCRLLVPELVALIPALQEVVITGASRKAELSLTVTWSDVGADLIVAGGKPLDAELRQNIALIAGKHGFARVTWEDELVAQETPPVQSFGGVGVVPPPGAFLQATAQGQADLTESVIEAVGEAKLICDLFAGCGTFSLPLAQKAEVWALESEAGMLAALDAGWRQAAGLHKITTEARDLFRRPVHATEMQKLGAVVIDPPRAGAETQVTEIATAKVARVAMVSCNPVTFARDAKILVDAGYTLDWVDVVDQFRWSPHVELCALFTRPAGDVGMVPTPLKF